MYWTYDCAPAVEHQTQRCPVSFSNRAIGWSVIVLGAVLTITLYLPGVSGPFLLDDWANLPGLFFDELNLRALTQTTSSHVGGEYGRPLSVLSFSLNYLFFGPNPLSFKLINLTLHIFCGLTLFYLLKWMLLITQANSVPNKPLSKETTGLILAGICCLIWWIHPLMVSTVLYTVQRMTQLSTLFSLGAFVFYLKGRWYLNQSDPKALIYLFFLTSTCACLAFLSKENGILVPIYLLFLDALCFRFRCPFHLKRMLWTFWIICICIPLCLALGVFIAEKPYFLAHYENLGYGVFERLTTQVWVLWYYIQLIFWPSLKELSLFHDDFPVIAQWTWQSSLLLLAHLYVMFLALRLNSKAPLVTIGIFWFYLGHLLESTFLPLELVFEHRNYLPSIGLMIAVMGIVHKISNKWILTAFLGLTIISFSVTTINRTFLWSNAKILYTQLIQTHPHSFRLNILMAHQLKHSGATTDEYKPYLLNAHTFAPKRLGPIVNLVQSHCQDSMSTGKSLELNNTVLANSQITPYGLKSLGELSHQIAQNKCPYIKPEKLAGFIEGLILHPYIHNNPAKQAFVMHILARIYFSLGKLNESFNTYDRAYLLHPKHINPLLEKLDRLIFLNHVKEAESVLSQIALINPKKTKEQKTQLQRLTQKLYQLKKNPIKP